ncbi:hypothetical protein B4098_2122 [Heyndrickxia coagulans]|uniref:Uncharacterized protein n=1 Tax=Heyndrickxia coagulans TaxID=1398 RepID=A0A150JQ97_HEYCO|nr:hypothetical protein B4098_2122 [Heyndrickxia coagulans]
MQIASGWISSVLQCMYLPNRMEKGSLQWKIVTTYKILLFLF